MLADASQQMHYLSHVFICFPAAIVIVDDPSLLTKKHGHLVASSTISLEKNPITMFSGMAQSQRGLKNSHDLSHAFDSPP